jgi:rod shape-determining protein MreD
MGPRDAAGRGAAAVGAGGAVGAVTWDGMGEGGGSRRAGVAIAVALPLAVLAQLSIVDRLNLPVGRPDLVLLLLSCVAMERGPAVGAVAGFGVGILADLASTHAVGQSAVVLAGVGYGVGVLAGGAGAADRSWFAPLGIVAGACGLGALAEIALAAILGDASMTGPQAVARAVGAALYALVLSPLAVPAVHGALRRLDGRRRDRLRLDRAGRARSAGTRLRGGRR